MHVGSKTDLQLFHKKLESFCKTRRKFQVNGKYAQNVQS